MAMAMNPNVNVANMNPMGGPVGGPVGGAPMPMMNNGAVNPQAAAAAAHAAAAAAARQQQANESQRSVLNTYIYDYFIRSGMFECARALLATDGQVSVSKEGVGRRRDENGDLMNGVDDSMDTDSKDEIEQKLPVDLPAPKLPMAASDTSFLYEWFSLFWDISNAQRAKGGNGTVNQYVAHTQQQSRLKQTQQQELLRQMRPDMAAQQQFMMRNMQNGGMAAMNMKQGNLARAAMANNQNNPQMQMLQQQAKQTQMQRDPSGMDRGDRPTSPTSGENAPSPKRQRLDGPQFNPNQPGAMMPNGRPMTNQQMATNAATASAHQMLTAHGINPNTLNPQQFQNFVNAPPAAQQKSIATYSQNLQQHHGTQMGTKQMPNAGVAPGQGSPMMTQGPDGPTLTQFYNPNEMGGPGGIRPGPGGAQAPGSSNHALQDYQMQLMLLEQQNKKRLMMARQEQDTIGGIPREGGGPGAPGPGPNGQPFPDASPQAMRTGASPNPAEQMKRGTPQMNNSGIPSPVPEGGQSRGSPNPAMNFMGNHVDPNMAGTHFFKNMEGGMVAGQQPMNMRPPSSHPGQPFNGQMNPQMIAAARQQQQQQQQQQQGQPQPQPQPGQPGQQQVGTPGQWQQGPNGQMMPQGMQQSPQIQGTPQQRAMPPPSAPAAAAAANANNRTTASPQQPAAAPPTPSQTNKSAPKKKDSKSAKDKRAAQKKNQNANAGATPAGDNAEETPAPATPITPAANFKNGQAGNQTNVPPPASAAPAAAVATTAPPAAPVVPLGQNDLQNGPMGMDGFGNMSDFVGGGMDLANPLQSGDVLNDFDFDSFLHDDTGGGDAFTFDNNFMENEIGAD